MRRNNKLKTENIFRYNILYIQENFLRMLLLLKSRLIKKALKAVADANIIGS